MSSGNASMHVAIEARALAAGGSGVATYAHELIRALAAVNQRTTYHVVLDRDFSDGHFKAAAERIVPRGLGGLPLWLHWQVPRELKLLHPDVVHFTKADVPMLSRWAAYKTVVTVYDVIPLLMPGTQTRLRRWYWPGALKRASTLSHHVLTISEASKRDLVQRFSLPAERVTVTPLAVDTEHFRPTARRLYTFPYILYVGRRDPRKNVAALVRAFAHMAPDIPHQLVIAGRKVRPDDGSAAEVERLGLQERVTWRDRVRWQDLPALYTGADAFVWPSIYEGWGFPPHEAMACGTPVIVSDGGALPEVVGEAGMVVPFSTAELNERSHDAAFEQRLTQAMAGVLADPVRRQVMRAQGLARARKRTWHDVAQATRRVYEKVSQE